MVLILIFLIIFVPWLTWKIIKESKKKKLAEVDYKKRTTDIGSIDYLECFHFEGLGIQHKAICGLYLFNEKLRISTHHGQFEVQLSKVRAAVVKSETELIEKGKSVVGRAILGNLIVPGLGAIVGGMSGIGTKKKRVAYYQYLILNYIGSDEEFKAVTFVKANISEMQRFCGNINSIIASSAPEVVQL